MEFQISFPYSQNPVTGVLRSLKLLSDTVTCFRPYCCQIHLWSLNSPLSPPRYGLLTLKMASTGLPERWGSSFFECCVILRAHSAHKNPDLTSEKIYCRQYKEQSVRHLNDDYHLYHLLHCQFAVCIDMFLRILAFNRGHGSIPETSKKFT